MKNEPRQHEEVGRDARRNIKEGRGGRMNNIRLDQMIKQLKRIADSLEKLTEEK